MWLCMRGAAGAGRSPKETIVPERPLVHGSELELVGAGEPGIQTWTVVFCFRFSMRCVRGVSLFADLIVLPAASYGGPIARERQ